MLRILLSFLVWAISYFLMRNAKNQMTGWFQLSDAVIKSVASGVSGDVGSISAYEVRPNVIAALLFVGVVHTIGHSVTLHVERDQLSVGALEKLTHGLVILVGTVGEQVARLVAESVLFPGFVHTVEHHVESRRAHHLFKHTKITRN